MNREAGIAMFRESTRGMGFGGLALLAGLLTAVVTVFALIKRKKARPKPETELHEEWEDTLGI
jgi:hypothetical protein